MRGTAVIRLKDYDIFSTHITSLKESSKDDSDKNNIQYMKMSTVDVVDFDAIRHNIRMP